MRRYIRNGIALAIVGSLLLVPLASAHEIEGENKLRHSEEHKKAQIERQKTQEELRQKVEAKTGEIQQKIEQKRTEIREKLDDAKKRICAKHEKTINSRMNHASEMRSKQIAHITTIADRTKAFVQTRGLSVENYDALVANVDAKSQTALTVLASVKSAASFNCGSDGPKADVQDFVTKRNSLVEAIREYRTAVKDLIKSVKTAQEAKEAQS